VTEPTTPEADAARTSAAGDPWAEAVALAEGLPIEGHEVVVEDLGTEEIVEIGPDGEAEVVAEVTTELVEVDGEPVALVTETVTADAVVEDIVTADALVETVVTDEGVVQTVVTDDETTVVEISADELVAAVEAEEAEEVVAEAEEIVAEAEELDEVEAFREATRTAPGEWYVIHSYAGYENRVKANLESRIGSLNMEDEIFQVEVPVEEVTEIKNGVRKQVKRNKFPGYVLVRCDLTDESWGAVRHTPGVTGFVGHGHQPSPLSLDEVVSILAPKPEKKPGTAPEKGTPRVVDFEVGDAVTIIEGAFGTMQASISEINPDTQKVIVMVELFGRETPVELTFNQIEKS